MYEDNKMMIGCKYCSEDTPVFKAALIKTENEEVYQFLSDKVSKDQQDIKEDIKGYYFIGACRFCGKLNIFTKEQAVELKKSS